ncbi:MAG: nucleoside-diphosphate sugar epimerase, partial [Catenulispora sp.]
YVYPTFEESWIDERDLAAVAACALLDDDLVGRRLGLTGPQSLSHAQGLSTIGAVLGRTLRFEEIHQMPGPFGAALMERYARHLDKPHFPATGEVAAVLGRPALTYAEWVAAHADAFRKETR